MGILTSLKLIKDAVRTAVLFTIFAHTSNSFATSIDNECYARQRAFFTAESSESDYRDVVFIAHLIPEGTGGDRRPFTTDDIKVLESEKKNHIERLTTTLFHIDDDGNGYFVTAFHGIDLLPSGKKANFAGATDVCARKSDYAKSSAKAKAGRSYDGRHIILSRPADGLSDPDRGIQLPEAELVAHGRNRDCEDVAILKANLNAVYDWQGRRIALPLAKILRPIGLRFDLPPVSSKVSFSGYGQLLLETTLNAANEDSTERELEQRQRHVRRRFQTFSGESFEPPRRADLYGAIPETGPVLKGHSGSLVVELNDGYGFGIVKRFPSPFSAGEYSQPTDQDERRGVDATVASTEFTLLAPIAIRKLFQDPRIKPSATVQTLYDVLKNNEGKLRQIRNVSVAFPPSNEHWRVITPGVLDCLGPFEALQLYGLMTRPEDDFLNWPFFSDGSTDSRRMGYEIRGGHAGFNIVRDIVAVLWRNGLAWEASDLIERAAAANISFPTADDIAEVRRAGASRIVSGDERLAIEGFRLLEKGEMFFDISTKYAAEEMRAPLKKVFIDQSSDNVCKQRNAGLSNLITEFGKLKELSLARPVVTDKDREHILQRIYAEAADCDASNPSPMVHLAVSYARAEEWGFAEKAYSAYLAKQGQNLHAANIEDEKAALRYISLREMAQTRRKGRH